MQSSSHLESRPLPLPQAQQSSSPDASRLNEPKRSLSDSAERKDIENEGSKYLPKDDKSTSTSTAKKSKKSSLITTIKSNIDFITLILMFKASLPPVIILSFYQSDRGASILGTLGYLSAIISVLSVPMLPRAKFLQALFATSLAAGLAAALATLVVYSAVEARLHTTPAPTPAPSATSTHSRSFADTPYNSSASAVSAVLFFFAIYFINYLRAKIPQIMFAIIAFSILIIVACQQAPLIPTVAVGMTFIKTLLKAFYFGLAVGTAVSLIVFPISCRMIIQKQFAGFLALLQKGLLSHQALFESLTDKENILSSLKKEGTTTEVENVNKMAQTINEIHGKIQADLPLAKQEIGYGKIGPDELKSLNKLSRLVMLPIIGLASVSSVLNHFAFARGWLVADIDSLPEAERIAQQAAAEELASNMQLVIVPFSNIIRVLIDGVDHVLYQLRLKPKPARPADVEGAPDPSTPGEVGFAQYLDDQSTEFYSSKHLTLIQWARSKGFEFPDDFFDQPDSTKILLSDKVTHLPLLRRQQMQRQLFILLYMEFLLHAAARSLLDLVIWSDKVVSSGLMSRNRLVIPSFKRITKLFRSTCTKDKLASDESDFSNLGSAPSYKVHLGPSFAASKDPEHLPPTNSFERFGNKVRLIPGFFKSAESAFGFRVACATMSIGIVLFLEATQRWCFVYRVFWAVIMTAISMSPSTGQSLIGFIMRAAATAIAMLLSWVIFYVPGNGKTPGILVMYWFFIFLTFWIPIKRPQLAILGTITIITITLVIGYSIEKNKIGQAAISSSGQAYLSTLVMAPVRLATVVAGLFVAFVWTVFPFPTEEHSIIRRDVAASLHLLANYYSLIHETVSARIRRIEGNMSDKLSIGRRLESARLNAFSKQSLLITSMRMNTIFTKWEMALGGRFPREKYEEIINSMEFITRFLSLIGYASIVYRDEDDDNGRRWSTDFCRLMLSLKPLTHENILVFSMLSGSMLDARPLPPCFPRPAPFGLSDQLEALDPTILSVSHINEPGYAAFAVIQLASRCVGLEIDKLIENVKFLVGTLDFSISIDDFDDSTDTLDGGEKKKEV